MWKNPLVIPMSLLLENQLRWESEEAWLDREAKKEDEEKKAYRREEQRREDIRIDMRQIE
jgi:hypothetical protein